MTGAVGREAAVHEQQRAKNTEDAWCLETDTKCLIKTNSAVCQAHCSVITFLGGGGAPRCQKQQNKTQFNRNTDRENLQEHSNADNLLNIHLIKSVV